ncbi:hypothetical protein [Nocardia sp. NPDC057668]|uniref:hypothetical protein n=1 Tax=Nocardia sp. NPDC057668 TaxID=3346202 RepID=UPI00366F9CF3
MSEQTIYPGSRAVQIMFAALSPVFVVMAVLFILVEEMGLPQRIVYGGGMLVLSLGATAVSWAALIRNKPELVLDREGVLIPEMDKILWHRVAAVRLRRIGPSYTVEIILNERAPWEPTMPLDGPVLQATASNARGHRAILLSPERLHPYSVEAILIEMQHYHPSLLVAPTESR